MGTIFKKQIYVKMFETLIFLQPWSQRADRLTRADLYCCCVSICNRSCMRGILGVGSQTEIERQYKSCFFFLFSFHFYSDCYIAICMALLMIVCQHNTHFIRGPELDVCVFMCRLEPENHRCCSLVQAVVFQEAMPLAVTSHTDLLHRARVTGVSPQLPAVLVSTL